MALPSDKNHKQFTGSRIFSPNKNILDKVSPVFCGKLETAVHSYLVENLFFSKLLGIFKKIQVVESDFSKFLQSAAIVRTDVLSGKIFHLQTNNYMTSAVSIPLITLRIWAESQFAFYIVQIQFQLSPIQFAEKYLEPSRTSMMERFCNNSQQLKDVNYFRKNSPSYLFDQVINTPHLYFFS